MQLDWLIYFSECVDAGTISAASQKLHISQPALSKTIKKLESELGQPLLKRTKQGVYPTAFGQKVYQEFQQMQSVMQSWYTHDQIIEPVGTIHICCIACASNYLYHNVITPFKTKYPKVDVILHDLRVQNVIQTLKTSPSNIAVTSLPSMHNNLIKQANLLHWNIHHLFTDERRILIGATHPLAAKDTLTLEDLKTLTLAYYSTEKDVISTIYEPYFASSYKVATRENIMDLVINNAAAFVPIFNLMQNEFYITKNLVKSYPLPLDTVNTQVPIVAITPDSLSFLENLFLNALLEHFSNSTL